MKHLGITLLIILFKVVSVQAQSNIRELVFTNTNPTNCSTTRLYINRNTRVMWANVDGICQPVGGGGSGLGDVIGPSSSADGEMLVASGNSGKLLRRSNTLTGFVRVVAGVASAAALSDSDLPTGIDAAKLGNGTVSNSEFQFLANVTSDIQTQLNAKQATDADLTTWAGLTPSANAQSLISAANYAAMRALLDLEAGTDFLGLPTGTPTGSKFLRDDNSWQLITGGGDALTTSPLSQFAATTSAQLASVLSDETGSGAFVRSTSPNITTPTGIVKSDVGLGNVDNTSDASKPVSTATQSALDLKVASTRTLSTTAPLTGGGDLSANRTLAIGDAAADGSTKGAATFTAADFNATSGNISIDYSNGQTASGSVKGFLTAADWTTFNSKVPTGAVTTSGLTMVTARLLGRSTASTGAVEEITIGSGLSLSSGTLSTTGGSGTVTVVSSGALTSTALVTGGGTTTLQTPSATATMDSSGNISTPGTVTSGAGSSEAGAMDLGEGTAAALVANTVTHAAGTDVPAAGVQYLWGTVAAGTGVLRVTNSSGVMTVTQDAGIQNLAASSSSDLAGVLSDEQGSGGGFVRATSPTLTTPVLGVATATSINGLTITSSTGTLTITNGKTASISNTLTFTGTDSSSIAFGTGGTVAYTIANGTSALGTSAIASGACATVVTTTATGTATTDTIGWGFNGDPTGVTGYQASANGMLTIIAYPSANNVNFKVCNNTASSVTPGAITLNWRVAR